MIRDEHQEHETWNALAKQLLTKRKLFANKFSYSWTVKKNLSDLQNRKEVKENYPMPTASSRLTFWLISVESPII